MVRVFQRNTIECLRYLKSFQTITRACIFILKTCFSLSTWLNNSLDHLSWNTILPILIVRVASDFFLFYFLDQWWGAWWQMSLELIGKVANFQLFQSVEIIPVSAVAPLTGAMTEIAKEETEMETGLSSTAVSLAIPLRYSWKAWEELSAVCCGHMASWPGCHLHFSGTY